MSFFLLTYVTEYVTVLIRIRRDTVSKEKEVLQKKVAVLTRALEDISEDENTLYGQIALKALKEAKKLEEENK